jgi:tRNA threonylcarbamoyladenosine biosynthesis protein TsaB
MKILALDTSTMVATVAVMEDERLLGEYVLNHKRTHSQKLLPMIKNIMDDLELTPKEIDIFAASTGPGSFTGLRIGVTTVKAMAFAAGKPVVSVPTLDAIAYNIPMSSFLVCPIMDARNNQVYTAIYSWNGRLQERVTDYLGVPVSELMDIIKERNMKVVFAGDAVEIHREYLKAELKENCEFALGHLRLPKASCVASIAFLKAGEGLIQNSFEMAPFYLRKSQAEREYEKKFCEATKGEGI